MPRPEPLDAVDVFAYTAVLGLFVQFLPGVVSESFALTLLTAVLLKAVLEVVVRLKTALLRRIRQDSSRMARVVSGATLLIVLPGSKFVVLELTAIVFRGYVRLGGFFAVTALIVALMLVRSGLRRLLSPTSAMTTGDDRRPVEA